MFYVYHLEDRELTCILEYCSSSEDIVECWSLSRSGEGEEVKHSYFPHFEAFLGGLLCAVLCVLCTSSGCRLYWQSKHRPRPGDTWPAPRRSPAVSHTRPPAVTPCHAAARCEDNAELRLGHCCLCPVSGLCTVTGHRAATGLASQHTLELQSKVREVFTIHGEGPTRVTTAFTFRNLRHYAKELTQGKYMWN